MATFAEKIRQAREQQKKAAEKAAYAASVEAALIRTNELIAELNAEQAADDLAREATAATHSLNIKIPTIEVTPVIASSTPLPKQRRRRVHRILLLPVKIAAVVVFTVGVAGGSMVFATVKSADLSMQKFAAAAHELPELLIAEPCNYNRTRAQCEG